MKFQELNQEELLSINGGNVAEDLGYALGYSAAVVTGVVLAPLLALFWLADNR